MAKRKLTDKLISKDDITEELRLIKNSETDYVTPSGKIYKDYGNNMFYPKRNFTNNHNGYVYCGITYENGNKQRRVHILVAQAYIPNPNNYPIVMHKDNNKENIHYTNLKWGTIQENTQQAVDDGLMINDKGYDDSQSIPVSMYDVYTRKLLENYGSCRMASKNINIPLNTIIKQAKHLTPVRQRVYFRFQKDGNINPPKIVIQYDYETDKELNRFYNIAEAHEKTEISAKTINQQCNNSYKPKTRTKSGTYFQFYT